jgi:chitodextrinase
VSTRNVVRTVVGVAAALVLILAAAGPAAAARPDRTPPTAPGNLRTTAINPTSVTFAWNPSTDNVRVVSYAVWAPGVPVLTVPATQTGATVNDLHPHSSYEFRVQAYDGVNWSFPSNLLTVTTARELNPPTAPANLAVGNTFFGLPVDGMTASAVLLYWASSTDDFGPIRYEVLVDGVPSPNTWSARPAGSPSGASSGAWVRQLRPGTTYQLAVRAVDGSGNVSAPSNAITVTTEPNPDTSAPTTPTLTSASVGGTGYCPEELWLRWTASSDDATPATAIEYEVRVNGAIIEVVPGGTQTVAYTEVLGANTVTIVAVDPAGNASGPSNAITDRTNWGIGNGCPP